MKSLFSSLFCLLFLSTMALAQQLPAALSATGKTDSEPQVISPQAKVISRLSQTQIVGPERPGNQDSEPLHAPTLPVRLTFEVKTRVEMVLLEGLLFTVINGRLFLTPGSGCFTPDDNEFAAKLQRAQVEYTRRLERKSEPSPTKTPSPK